MPAIERSVAYTFDAYSGGIVDDPGRGKQPRFEKERRYAYTYASKVWKQL